MKESIINFLLLTISIYSIVISIHFDIGLVPAAIAGLCLGVFSMRISPDE